MEYMEKDFINGAHTYGPTNFCTILFNYNIMSSSNLEVIELLSKYYPPRNVSVVLVELLSNNVKDPTVFKNFIEVLGNISPLHYLYNKIDIINGWSNKVIVSINVNKLKTHNLELTTS